MTGQVDLTKCGIRLEVESIDVSTETAVKICELLGINPNRTVRVDMIADVKCYAWVTTVKLTEDSPAGGQ